MRAAVFTIGSQVRLALFALVALSACSPAKAPCGVPDPDLTASPQTQLEACEKAGDRLWQLGCPGYRTDFVEFCMHMLANNIPIRPTCISLIQSCDDVDGKCR